MFPILSEQQKEKAAPRGGAGPALIPAWTSTDEAAPRFAVFQAWAPRTMAAGARLQAPLRLRESTGHGGGRIKCGIGVRGSHPFGRLRAGSFRTKRGRVG